MPVTPGQEMCEAVVTGQIGPDKKLVLTANLRNRDMDTNKHMTRSLAPSDLSKTK